jgi:RNAse (barnase) inhibitor barstar
MRSASITGGTSRLSSWDFVIAGRLGLDEGPSIMIISVSNFLFDIDLIGIDYEVGFIAQIPKGIGDRKDLFATLVRLLQLPPYFGNNWDALYDSLRDLSWIRCREITLIHDDLPMLDNGEIVKYLEILSDCIQDWKLGEAHELAVAFPSESRDASIDIITR